MLSCLESFRNLIRCSAVRKSWKEASQKVQPVSLDMPVDLWISASTDRVVQLNSILQFLQLQDRKGRFCNLHHLQVSLIVGVAIQTMHEFMRSFLTLAGSLELHSCHIHSCFLWDAAVALLPNCLQHIALSSFDEQLHEGYVLHEMRRFPDLRTLHLEPDTSGPPSIMDFSVLVAEFVKSSASRSSCAVVF